MASFGCVRANAGAYGIAYARRSLVRKRRVCGVRQPPAAQRSLDGYYPDADRLRALPVLLATVS